MELEYRDACGTDLDKVVRVHLQAFAGFFLSKLGARFLLKYYRLILEHPCGILIVALDKNDVIGFVSGFSDPAEFYSQMKNRKISFALASLPALLSSPGVIRRLLIDFRAVRAQARPASAHETGVGELSSIGVDPVRSGHGVGRGLLDAFIAEARRRGRTAVTLITDADGNEDVNRFYAKAGFHLRRVFVQGDGRRMNEYWLDL